MYVGITRARKTLTLSYCERRKRGGEWMACEPSRFIAEMGDDIQQPDGTQSDEARQQGSDRLAALKAMLAG
jgi:ATP-dependent DNA helicase Rep